MTQVHIKPKGRIRSARYFENDRMKWQLLKAQAIAARPIKCTCHYVNNHSVLSLEVCNSHLFSGVMGVKTRYYGGQS